MAVNPDVSPYIDLTVFDRDPSQLVARAVADAAVKLPGWVPAEGNTEMVLIEAVALEIAELVFAVNRLPGGIAEALLKLFGIVRDPGAPAQGTFTFNLSDTLGGRTIPAGTRIQVTLPDGPLTFATDTAIAVPAGPTTVTGTATAQTNTDAANATAAGTQFTLVDSVVFVNSVVLTGALTAGRDPESDADWLTRGTATLTGLTSTAVTAAQFATMARNDTADGVFRAYAADTWDPTANGGAGATATGHVTVAVIGQGGLRLTTAQKANVQTLLAGAAMAGLAVHVVDPNVTTVPITATVFQDAGYTQAQVQANCLTALQGVLSTDSWQWGSTLRVNDLIALLTAVDGVAFVMSITDPTNDVVLGGVAPLVSLGLVTINVQGP